MRVNILGVKVKLLATILLHYKKQSPRDGGGGNGGGKSAPLVGQRSLINTQFPTSPQMGRRSPEEHNYHQVIGA